MNKKGLFSALQIMLFFAILATTVIFTAVLVKESGETYFIEPTADIGRGILNDTSIPAAQGVNAITNLETEYANLSFPYDLFFLILWIFTFSTTLFSTFKSTKTGIFSFFGMVFVGSMLLLLITSFLSDYTGWFMAEIFYKVFADVAISLPIFNYYINNLGIINFVWFLILLIVSVIDRGFISRTGEVQE